MNSMKTYLCKIACPLLVALSISSAVSAQTISAETLRQIDKIMERYKPTNPGCQISISIKGKIVFSKAYGMADLEHNLPLTIESVLDAGKHCQTIHGGGNLTKKTWANIREFITRTNLEHSPCTTSSIKTRRLPGLTTTGESDVHVYG